MFLVLFRLPNEWLFYSVTNLPAVASTPDLAAELSRDPVVLKGEFLGRLGYAAPVIGQILTRPNPYRDALIKARLYKASDFSMPNGHRSLRFEQLR
jgi:hypothetical protein